MWDYLVQKLGLNEEGVSPDGTFWLREAECLGACDTPPVLQIEGRRMVFNLTPEKADAVIDMLRRGELPPFESVPVRNSNPL